MNIYVGNLARSVNEEKLSSLFSAYGDVKNVKIIKDHETGEPRGFAFVDIFDDTAGRRAIEELNGQDFEGRRLTVNEARPKTGGGSGAPQQRRPFNRDRDRNRDGNRGSQNDF